jgi:sugar-phosphatase
MRAPALLSDLDGVLVDSTPAVLRVWRRWAEANGIAFEEEIAWRLHGVPSRQTIAAVAPQLDAELEEGLLSAAQVDDVEGVVALPGARELLGNGYGARVAIVTSCDRQLAEARLNAAALTAPRVMITSDHVARGKPDPEPYLLGAERLGYAPGDCVVVEDAPAGVAAGKAAGMRVVAVLTTHAADDLREADDVVADLRGLPDVLAR